MDPNVVLVLLVVVVAIAITATVVYFFWRRGRKQLRIGEFKDIFDRIGERRSGGDRTPSGGDGFDDSY